MLFAENTNVFATVIVAIITFGLCALVAWHTFRESKKGGCASCGTRSSCPYAKKGSPCSCQVENTSKKDELSVLFDRQIELLQMQAPMQGEDFLANIAASALENAYVFSDIDYQDQTPSFWMPRFHCVRIRQALLQKGIANLAADKEFCERIEGLLRYWVKKDYTNPNWWQNQIGTPLLFADIALLLEAAKAPFFDHELRDGIAKIVYRGTLLWEKGNDKEFSRIDPAILEGANLIWVATVSIKYALFQKDEALLRHAADRIQAEVKIAEQGIQEDGGFFQHGPLWYSGGYGRSYTKELAPFFALFEGTAYAFSEEKTNLFLRHVLDGQKQMQHRGFFDYGAIGREFSRQGALKANMENAICSLADVSAMPKKEALAEFLTEMQGKLPQTEKTTYFDSICQLCHKADGSYIGVKGLREGLRGTEVCNREGVLAYNMSYGTFTCLMRSGKEYFDIAPLWDYSAIPGTTARKESDEALLAKPEWHGEVKAEEGFAPICYGKAEEKAGWLGMKAKHDGISICAAYFTFGGALVALGADIKDASPEKGEVFTTVNQCFAENADLSSISEGKCACGGFIYENVDESTVFTAKVERKTGSWYRNNQTLPKDEVSGEIFTLQIPKTDKGTYAYIAYPAAEKAPLVRVLQNDRKCQAILANETVYAVFYEEGALSLPNGAVLQGNAGECLSATL